VRGLSSLAWRNLRARLLRSVLTMAGVALGVAVLFASLSAGATMDAAVARAAADEMGPRCCASRPWRSVASARKPWR